jgi:hypothetical protein
MMKSWTAPHPLYAPPGKSPGFRGHNTDPSTPGGRGYIVCNHLADGGTTTGFPCGTRSAVGLVDNIASSATPCSTDIFAQYTYLGDGTIVGVSSRRAGTCRARGKSPTRMCIVRRAPSGSEVGLAVTSRERKRAG